MDTNALVGRMAPQPAARFEPESDLLRDLMRLLGASPAERLPLAHVPVALRRLDAKATLFHEGAPLRSLYVVRTGSLKVVRTLEDGYEQVAALALPGDVLGFDGLHAERQASTVVALESCMVYALPLACLKLLLEQCPPLNSAWQRALSRQLARSASTAYMLAAVAADVRLARFMLSLSSRAGEFGGSPTRLRLSMSRRDIASLLGVAHETVSRSFTAMDAAGVLAVNNRWVDILDLAQLRDLARCTRRATEAAPGEPAPGCEAAR